VTEFVNKSFSVYPGGEGGQTYRDNWSRIFEKANDEEVADADEARVSGEVQISPGSARQVESDGGNARQVESDGGNEGELDCEYYRELCEYYRELCRSAGVGLNPEYYSCQDGPGDHGAACGICDGCREPIPDTERAPETTLEPCGCESGNSHTCPYDD
jgi:hypothetical protein